MLSQINIENRIQSNTKKTRTVSTKQENVYYQTQLLAWCFYLAIIFFNINHIMRLGSIVCEGYQKKHLMQ
jgi:hypothetical protein